MMKRISFVLCILLIFMSSTVMVRADDAVAQGVKWSPDGHWIAVNTSSGVWVFDAENPDAEPKVYYEGQEIRLSAFNPVTGNLVVLISDWANYTYKRGFVNLETGEADQESIMYFNGGGDSNPISPDIPVYEMAYSADASFSAMTLENLLYFYNADFNRWLGQRLIFDFGTGYTVSLSQMGSTNNILLLSWSDENKLVLVNQGEGIVSNYDVDVSGYFSVYSIDETHALLVKGDAIDVLDTDASDAALLAAAPEDNSFETSAYLASTGTLYVGGYGYWQSIDVSTGSVNLTVKVESEAEHMRFVAFDFNPDGSQVVSLQSDGKVTIWDSTSGESVRDLGTFAAGMSLKWG